MGSRLGYSYGYQFYRANLDDIKSRMKGHAERLFIFEMRTKFIILGRKTAEQQDASYEIIDSETYDVFASVATRGLFDIDFFADIRLDEYWMSREQINLFCEDAMAFANEMAAEDASLSHVAVIVRFQVCTVQQEGESYAAAKRRAIRALKLTPLYLYEFQTAVNKPLSPLSFKLKDFLAYLPRVRVEDVDQAWALMPACALCLRRPRFGDQITVLPCNPRCAFHSHCIIAKLENDNKCPTCRVPAYDSSFLTDSSGHYLDSDHSDSE